MNIEKEIEVTIETQAIGNILTFVPYKPFGNVSTDGANFILSIPNRRFFGTDFTNLDLSMVAEHDVEMFKSLNEHSDKEHQIDIDTLTVYGVIISGPYIRIQYWFNQHVGDSICHRMCAGVLTHCVSEGNYMHQKNEITRVAYECYSQDVAVYW